MTAQLRADTLGGVLSPGTHLRVHRRLPYWHHGIAVEDSELIEFGGSPWDKANAQIRRVSLDRFVKGDPVETVPHPISWFGLTYSPYLPPEQVVDRAEWLLRHQPPPYRPGYRNCESVA